MAKAKTTTQIKSIKKRDGKPRTITKTRCTVGCTVGCADIRTGIRQVCKGVRRRADYSEITTRVV